jgi:hypothetical protein
MRFLQFATDLRAVTVDGLPVASLNDIVLGRGRSLLR